MGLLGGLLIFLAIPLFIGYAIGGEPKKIMWRNLGILLGVVGLVIVLLSSRAGQ